MKQFTHKDTLVKNITYMALMAAINVVFVLLTTFVPVLFFLIVFVLPLTSTIVTLHCQKRYFPIYAIATIGLCLICTIWKIDDTIFYVIPSIISGFIFGLLIEKKISAFWIILITTVIQIGFSYASIPLIELMTGRNIIEVFATAFGINDFTYLDYVVPLFIFFISITQEVFSYIVIKEEVTKFGYHTNEGKIKESILLISLYSSLALMLIFTFIYAPIAYLFALFTLFIGLILMIQILMENKVILYILFGGDLLITLFFIAIFYNMIPAPLGLLTFTIFFALEGIIVLINNYLLKGRNKDTI